MAAGAANIGHAPRLMNAAVAAIVCGTELPCVACSQRAGVTTLGLVVPCPADLLGADGPPRRHRADLPSSAVTGSVVREHSEHGRSMRWASAPASRPERSSSDR
jgi:hypothetical protein